MRRCLYEHMAEIMSLYKSSLSSFLYISDKNTLISGFFTYSHKNDINLHSLHPRIWYRQFFVYPKTKESARIAYVLREGGARDSSKNK